MHYKNIIVHRMVAGLLIILLVMGVTACSQWGLSKEPSPGEVGNGAPAPSQDGLLRIHFIDVGQGDAILLQSPWGQNMVIDAGRNKRADDVVEYIKGQGVKRVDVLIGTHPHEDHIGGLDAVIKNFDIGCIYMPKVSHTTKTFMDVLEAVKLKGLKIKPARAGMDIPLKGIQAQVLAPEADPQFDELNNYSIVIRLVHNKTSFIFQGDAELESEKKILEAGANIGSDLIKIGHHGSVSSTHRDYLEAVNPAYAVVMVGKENEYHHPHRETMEVLEEKGITVFRTDECGTIVATSDGERISFDREPGTYTHR